MVQDKFNYTRNKIKWHGTPMHRLRLVSFVAEQFWKLVFCERMGFNELSPGCVTSVGLSKIEVDGVKKRGETYIEVSAEDSLLALKIARAVADLLAELGFRILDAVVGASVGGEHCEHDLVGERRGFARRSSIEVKCKSIKKEVRLEDTFRGQMRKAALKLWKPAEFSERVVVLVQFDARVALDAGWKMIRCEAYDGLRWKNLHGWGGPPATKISPPPGVGRGVKRKRGGSNKIVDNSSSSGSDARSVVVDGEQYTTLPDFLGKTPVKSQKQVADKCAGEGKVEIRGGNSTSLVAFRGAEILAKSVHSNFRAHRWVNTLARGVRSKEPLQARLLSRGQRPASQNFLWSKLELDKCRAVLSK
jgi:hypothetical protein